MAQRYRLMQVRNNALVKKHLFDIPSTTTNNVTIPYINPNYALHSYGDFANTVVAGSNDTLLDFTNNFLWAEWIGDPGFTYLRDDYGFRNGIVVADMQVGDRFYVNKWDNSHSYIEVTDKISTGAGLNIMLDYKTPDGTIAYSGVVWNVSWNANQYNAYTLPWVWDLSNPGNYNLTTMDLSIYLYGGNNGVFTQGKSTKAPTTEALAESFWDDAEILDPENPYSGGGESDTGGGDANNQNFDDESDSVTTDPLPTIGAVNSGMVSVFAPDSIQLSNLADLLFSYNFFDWLQKNLQNLEELFVSLGTVPFHVSHGSAKSVTWLGFDISQFAHPVYLYPATAQYEEIDMGDVVFDGTDSRIHTTDSVFDYSPFSTLGVYLPFIGFQELDIDEVRKTTLNLRYRIDIVSGTCIAILKVTDDRGSRDIYQFSGNCLTQIPLGSVDMSGIIGGSIQIATSIASAGSAGAIASAGDAMVEGLNGESMSALQKDYMHTQNAARVSNASGNLAAATANGMMGMKPNYKHSGAIGNSGSMIAVKQPYLYLKTPHEAVPKNYEKYSGFPSNITAKLGSCSGFTVVENIRLNGLIATAPEVEEIYTLLKSGVII